MKKIASFSGGRTSAYMCELLIEMYGNDVDFIFMDTGAEHPETYEFIRKVDVSLGLNLKCLKAKINPQMGKGTEYEVLTSDEIGYDLSLFSEFVSKYGVPYYPNGASCTHMLKNVPFYKYCDKTYGKGKYETWIGIRADEPRRLNRKVENRKYLADISDKDKEDILNHWELKSFNLDIPEWLGNCVFCIHKKWSKLALSARDEPQMASEFINMVNNNARDKGKGNRVGMYEKGESLQTVINMFSDIEYKHLKELTIRGRRLDTGSCSESCEPLTQTDMIGLDDA